jgi:glycosyltransferase involved in cell wall biosynthesis
MYNDKSKIIHLFAPGPIGGAEKVIISGLKALQLTHKEIELWLIKETRNTQLCNKFLEHLELEKINIKINIFETKKPLDLSLIKNLKESFAVSDVKIIHAHGIKASFYGNLSKPKKVKFILTHHGNTSHTLKVKVYEYIEQKIMQRSDATIAVSQTMKNDLLKKNIQNVELVENLLSFEPITRTLPENDKLEMTIIGRLSPEKGHIDLLKALSTVKFNFNLKIIGTGSETNIIQEYIEENNLHKSVQLLGFKKDINSYLFKTDVLLMPSHREGLPMILIEAICSGVPVLGSSVGALKYLVTDNGILFESQNISEIKNSLKLFVVNKSNYLDTAIKKASIFQERFHPQKWVNSTIEVYKKVLSQE